MIYCWFHSLLKFFFKTDKIVFFWSNGISLLGSQSMHLSSIIKNFIYCRCIIYIKKIKTTLQKLVTWIVFIELNMFFLIKVINAWVKADVRNPKWISELCIRINFEHYVFRHIPWVFWLVWDHHFLLYLLVIFWLSRSSTSLLDAFRKIEFFISFREWIVKIKLASDN